MNMSTSSLKCFVIMPAGNKQEYQGGVIEANFVFDMIIKPAVLNALGDNVIVHREIDNNTPGAITSSIVQNLAKADVVIVDITGRNPNVFLELGIRYALRRKNTILLRRSDTIIPFDINVFRSIEYNPFGFKEAVNKLSLTIQESIKSGLSDSLVYDVYRNLEVNLHDMSDDIGLMPWSSYWERLGRIAKKLQEASVDGKYTPHIMVGITNGGGVFMDLLSRKLGYRGPLVSLWADRSQTMYFRNPVNLALCDGMRQYLSQNSTDAANILLVDDIIASGHTYRQASHFLSENMNKCDVRFLPLFYKNDSNYREVENLMVWRLPELNVSPDDVADMHRVQWIQFPYEKEIRSN